MNKKGFLLGIALILAATPVMAHMMKGGPQMIQQQSEESQQQQNTPCQMYPGMMGGYGHGMGPQMMGDYGYGMGPMMGGYGMGPQMMGGYGYGMGPQMMGNYGYGMGPMMGRGFGMGCMMGGYGMGPQMMGNYGMQPPCYAGQVPYFKSPEEYTKYLDDTREIRRKLHILMFDYHEASRVPQPDIDAIQEIQSEMNKLREQLANYNKK